MKCSNCNESILKEDIFCGNCGNKIIRKIKKETHQNKTENTEKIQNLLEIKNIDNEVYPSKNKIQFDLISKTLLILIICSFLPFILISGKNINKSNLYLNQAKDFFQKDSFTKSIVKIDQSIATYFRPEALKIKAEIRIKQRRFYDASQLYKKLIEDGYKIDSLKIDYGYTLIKSNEFEKGLDYITKALLSENKRKFSIRYVNEVLENSEKQTNKNLLISLATMNIALENERDITDLFNRARVLYLLDMYNKSIKDYTEYIDKNPTYWGAYLNRGMALYHFKEYQGAINDLNYALKIIKEEKWLGSIYNYLAKSYYSIKQYRKSYQYFKKAIDEGYSVSNSLGSDYWFVKRQLNIK